MVWWRFRQPWSVHPAASVPPVLDAGQASPPRLSRACLLRGGVGFLGQALTGWPTPATMPGASPDPRAAGCPGMSPAPTGSERARLARRVSSQPTGRRRYTPESPRRLETARLAVLGDCGVRRDSAREVAAEVHRHEPDAVVLLGDLDYSERGDVDVVGPLYGRYMAPYHGAAAGEPNGVNRLVAVPGDHDLEEGKRRNFERYYDIGAKGYSYTFRVGPVALFTLNSRMAARYPASHMAWLRSALSASMTDPGVAWRFVVSSTPPESSGRHGSCPALQWPYAAWGADGVLSGDNHSFERLLYDRLTCDGQTLHGNQFNLISGMGGQNLYMNNPLPGPWTCKRLDGLDGDFGFSLLVATEEALQVTLISRRGTVMDHCLLRHADPTKPPYRRLIVTEPGAPPVGETPRVP
jgi:hypothetical protein